MVWKHLESCITSYQNEESTLVLIVDQVCNLNKHAEFAGSDTALISILATTKAACISLFLITNEKFKF